MAENHTYYLPFGWEKKLGNGNTVRSAAIIGPFAEEYAHILYGIWLQFIPEAKNNSSVHRADGVSLYQENDQFKYCVVRSRIEIEKTGPKLKYETFGPFVLETHLVQNTSALFA